MRWYDEEIANEEEHVESESSSEQTESSEPSGDTGISGDAGNYDASDDTSVSNVSYDTGIEGDVGQFDSSEDVVNFSEISYDDPGTGVEGDVGPVDPEEVIDVSDIHYDDPNPTEPDPSNPSDDPNPFINPGDIDDPNNPVIPGIGIEPIGPGPIVPPTDGPSIPEEPIIPGDPIDDPTIPVPTTPDPVTPEPIDPIPPGPIDPVIPAPTEPPTPVEPVPTEPVPTEPVPTEPVPTEPVPTEPVPTEPVPTEPKKPVKSEPKKPIEPDNPRSDEHDGNDYEQSQDNTQDVVYDSGYSNGSEVDNKRAGIGSKDSVESSVVAVRKNANGDAIKLYDMGNGTYVLNNGAYNAMCAPDGKYYVPNPDGSLTQLDANALTTMFGDVRNYGTQLYSQSVVKANMPSSQVVQKPVGNIHQTTQQEGRDIDNARGRSERISGDNTNYARYLKLAKETVRGNYGNADERKAEFARRGIDYDKVQDIINYYNQNGGLEQLASVTATKEAGTLRDIFRDSSGERAGSTSLTSSTVDEEYLSQLQERLKNSKHDTERQEIAKKIAAEKSKMTKPDNLNKVQKAAELVDDINSNRINDTTFADLAR